MMDRDAVCVLLPAYEESETVGTVVADFREAGFDDVLVVDGGSTDGTRAVAREEGARVEIQSGQGKGQAIREAVREYVDKPYVLLADADCTYQVEDAEAMLEPLFSGEAEHVIGNRYGNIHEDAMTRFNDLGNSIFNWLFRVINGEDFVDILSGYRAFTVESFERLQLRADGFGIETEMSVECARHSIPVTVVPITYMPRPDGSSTKLHPLKDGWIILAALYRKAKTSNPLFYFGTVGVVSGVAGAGIEAFVAYDWFVNRTPHEVLAFAGGTLIILGIQFLIFAVLSDLVVTLHNELLDRIETVEDRLPDE
ncbi:MAG: S-layer glycoprotein N-glycosyltransferase AglJ [Halobaculum sp.]